METQFHHISACAKKQSGVVLFFALIALVVMSLAAVALIRSVDTSTLIAGNLALKQTATTSADAGAEAAITWLASTTVANVGKSVYTDSTNTFNNTGGTSPCCVNAGYYSNANPATSLTDGTGITWTSADSASAGSDSSGNSIRYVIQRMCRPPPASQLLSTDNCLFSEPASNTSGRQVALPPEICDPSVSTGCPIPGQAPQYRITVRVAGQKNTFSFIQAFVY